MTEQIPDGTGSAEAFVTAKCPDCDYEERIGFRFFDGTRGAGDAFSQLRRKMLSHDHLAHGNEIKFVPTVQQ